MNRFEPRLDVLPKPQQALWPDLRQVPKGFVLYGGTGLSLRLGHRQSIDFDFFTSEKIIPERLIQTIPFLADGKVLQNESQTLTMAIDRGGLVKVSFFGGLNMGRVRDPEETIDGILRVASLLDIAATKAKVVQQRAESKDYIDIIAILDHGIKLSEMLGAARALYGDPFNPMFTIKSLSYFGDGDLHVLSQRQKQQLVLAASERFDIPEVVRVSDALSGLC